MGDHEGSFLLSTGIEYLPELLKEKKGPTRARSQIRIPNPVYQSGGILKSIYIYTVYNCSNGIQPNLIICSQVRQSLASECVGVRQKQRR